MDVKHIYNINEITKIAMPIAASYGIGRLYLFGSYARGDATADSDIDFLIDDLGSLCGLFELAGFRLDLEEQFGVSVDVLTVGGLDDDFLAIIQAEEILIYESHSLTA